MSGSVIRNGYISYRSVDMVVHNLVVVGSTPVVVAGRILAVDYSRTAVPVAARRTLNYSQVVHNFVAETRLIVIAMIGQIQLTHHSWGRMSRYQDLPLSPSPVL